MSDDRNIIISACLVVHNEEKIIERCLKSIALIADEIIVVHDGPCNDKTLDIATKYGAKIIMVPRVGNCDPIRPLIYEAAQGEWILQIDADEFLSTELQIAIPKLILEEGVDAYEFLWPLYNGQRYVTKNWPYKRSLFRRSAISHLGIPDYVVEVKGIVKKIPLLLEHQPNYDNLSFHVFVTKWVKIARIKSDLYLKNFSDVPKFNYQSNEWPKIILWRRRFPLLIAVPDFFVVFIDNLISGAYKEGLAAWKLSFLFGVFRLIIDWLVFWGKVKGKIKN